MRASMHEHGFDGAAGVAPGMPLAELDTPTLVLDLDAMERNIERMAQFAAAHGVQWRPHAKLHKSARIAQRLVAAGASGCCVQKVAEAQALAAGGVRDIYISNQVLAPQKLRRVAALARHLQQQGGRLALAVDSAQGVAALAQALQGAGVPQAVEVFIEIDIGQHRAGVAPGAPAVALAQNIASQRQLRLAGLHAYHGGAQHIEEGSQRAAAMQAAHALVRQTLEQLHAAGFADLAVTGAGTGTFALEAASGLYTELQPGSFLCMDAHYARVQPVPQSALPGPTHFEHALFIKTQVLSSCATHAVVDAGHKSHAIDSGLPMVWNQGQPPLYEFRNGGDEHGIVAPRVLHGALHAPVPALGQTLWLVPGHCDPTVNLHDAFVGIRGGLAQGVVQEIIPIDARGALW